MARLGEWAPAGEISSRQLDPYIFDREPEVAVCQRTAVRRHASRTVAVYAKSERVAPSRGPGDDDGDRWLSEALGTSQLDPLGHAVILALSWRSGAPGGSRRHG